MTDLTGYLVEFIDKNRMVLALTHSGNKVRLQILTSNDKQVALNRNRALLNSRSSISTTDPRQNQVDYMRNLEARREELSRQVEVEELWELVHEERDEVPLEDLAELVFGAEATEDHQSAVLRALFNERLHFKLAGNKFQPLSKVQLEQKQIQMEKEAQNRAFVDAAVEYLKNLPRQGRLADFKDPPPEGLFEMLRDLVIFEEESPTAKKSKEIATLAELGGRKKLYYLLVRLGVLNPNENLPLLREGLPVEFDRAVMQEVLGLDPGVSLNGSRKDLSDMFTFTIDGAFTTDFDDALSFEPDPDGGGVIGVHITDAACIIEQNSMLDLEARERASTLYMPDDRIPMLPPALSEDALSLKKEQVRPAITLLAKVEPDGQVSSFELVRSKVRVDWRLTYEEADELIFADPNLAGLQKACQALKQRRGHDGAYFLPLPEVLVGVDEDKQVWVKRIDREGPSREMVAETAILANQLKAQFLNQEKVPALYRTQAPPKEPIEEGGPEQLFLHFKQRRLLNRVEITTKAGRHSSLGITPYTHATSPIRRYLDLVVQRQLSEVLGGNNPPFNAKEMEALAMLVTPNVRRLNRVRQARQRYWILKWLETKREDTIPGIVMEYQVRRWQILLSDIMMLATISNQPGLKLEPGMDIRVKLERVDAFDDILRIALA